MVTENLLNHHIDDNDLTDALESIYSNNGSLSRQLSLARKNLSKADTETVDKAILLLDGIKSLDKTQFKNLLNKLNDTPK